MYSIHVLIAIVDIGAFEEVGRLLLQAETQLFQAEEAKKGLIGLARDLRGLAYAFNTKTSYMMLFDWMYPFSNTLECGMKQDILERCNLNLLFGRYWLLTVFEVDRLGYFINPFRWDIFGLCSVCIEASLECQAFSVLVFLISVIRNGS